VVRTDAEGTRSCGQGFARSTDSAKTATYFWRFDDQRGWHSGFNLETEELVETASVGIPEGGTGKLGLPVKYGRYRLEITDPQTQVGSSKLRFYAGWSARADEGQGRATGPWSP